MTFTASIPTTQRTESSTGPTRHAYAIDGFVENVAVAMLTWSRAREQRALVNHAEHSQRRQLRDSIQQREANALRMTQRLGL
ncbi:MAG: hypothetical protein KF801_07075 [Cryobacterium sp.]|jgi:hypothetical protein|nr:hypothetical protein [Cryobacterium sp.]